MTLFLYFTYKILQDIPLYNTVISHCMIVRERIRLGEPWFLGAVPKEIIHENFWRGLWWTRRLLWTFPPVLNDFPAENPQQTPFSSGDCVHPKGGHFHRINVWYFYQKIPWKSTMDHVGMTHQSHGSHLQYLYLPASSFRGAEWMMFGVPKNTHPLGSNSTRTGRCWYMKRWISWGFLDR